MGHKRGLLWQEELVAEGLAVRPGFVPAARTQAKVPKSVAFQPTVRRRGGERAAVDLATWHVGDEPSAPGQLPATLKD